MAKQIDSDVLEILAGIECEGNAARITQQLDRKMYVRVNKVLEALGGKWSRKAKAHLFEAFDSFEGAIAATIIGDAVTTGEYIDERKEYQFFETPQAIVDMIVERLEIEPGMVVLEPSAGMGAIARIMRDAGGSVECVEINERMVDHLMQDDFAVHCEDFLILDPPVAGMLKEAGKEPRWIDEHVDRVGMNPPFSRSQDILHVRHAFEWLKPGGRLVAIMGIGWTFRQDRKATEFREWLEALDGEREPLPDNAFREAGTGVKAVIVTVDRPEGDDEE